MIYYAENSKIEGQSVFLDCRKFLPLPPVKDKKLGYIIYRFSIKDNARAVIVKELDPKKCIYDPKSILNKDHGIHGEIITGFSKKRVPDYSVAPKTGRHKAQNTTTKDFTYAKIERAWQAIMHKQKKITK